jgi:hypothetical protein
LTETGLNCFAFELYDVDKSGVIDTRELIQLAHDMYPDFEHDPMVKNRLQHTLDLIKDSHPNTVTLAQFEHTISIYPLLTFPAHQSQRLLQGHTGGAAFWKRLVERRLLGKEQGAMYNLKHLVSSAEELIEDLKDDQTDHHRSHHHNNHEGEKHGVYVHTEHVGVHHGTGGKLQTRGTKMHDQNQGSIVAGALAEKHKKSGGSMSGALLFH